MKSVWTILAIGSGFLFSCGSGSNNNVVTKPMVDTAAIKKQRFFPVTNFLLGDLAAIKQKGVNPIKITVSGQKKDSAWLTLEQLPIEVGEFLQPVIDSTNLITFYKETSFQDQTINTFTFTHEPLGQLPDSLNLKRWDVYVDAGMQTVKKIYMVKQMATGNGSKTMQLTWDAGRQCKMVTLNADNSAVEKEVTISWDF
jgi:hypothetical protein